MIFDHHHTFIVEERKTVIINTPAEEESFLNNAEYLNENSWEEVDYEQYSVIGIIMPAQSSGSHRLTIEGIEVTNSGLLVKSQLFIPCIGTDDIGHPSYFVKIRKSDMNIIFDDTEIVEENCEIINIVDLVNKKWILKEYQELNSRVLINQETDLDFNDFWLELKDYSQVEGKASCNVFSGAYTITESGSIEFLRMSWTEAWCEFSDIFINHINNSTLIELTPNNELILKSFDSRDASLIYLKFQESN